MFLRPLLVFLALLATDPQVAASDALRCGSRIVSVEAHAAEVLAACGEPAFRDVYARAGSDHAGEIADHERWTYNFGRNQLLQVLRLRNRRLVDIRTDGYGFPVAAARRCDASILVEGLSKYRLLSHCGEPLTRRTLGFRVALQPHHRQRYGGWSTTRGQVPVEVYREEWVYNFGSQQFLRILTLYDGVVSEVQNGERGFNPR